jgi:hypothetical protein
VLSDSKCVNNTEFKGIRTDNILVGRAWATTMSKMEDETKFLESYWLEEVPIPLLNEVKW